MRLDLTVYSGLLAVGLGAAYWASLPVEEGEEEKTQVLTIDPKSVAAVTVTGKDGKAVIEVQSSRDARTGRHWVSHVRTDPPKEAKAAATGTDTATDPTATDAAAPGTDTGTAVTAAPEVPPAEPKVTKERFLANDKFDELLKGFSPLVAARVLGKVTDAQLEEFGLKERTARLEVKDAAGKALFTAWLGKKSYGSRNRFVLEETAAGPGRVLLIGDEGIENLERAPLRLYERRIVNVAFDEVSRAEIRAGDRSKRMAHTQRGKDGELLWTEEEENAAPKPSFDSWMDKISKLRLQSYAEESDEQALAGVAPFLEVAFEKDGKEIDRVIFRKLPGEKATYFVTSRFLGVHAKVVESRVEPIEKDIETIVTDNKS